MDTMFEGLAERAGFCLISVPQGGEWLIRQTLQHHARWDVWMSYRGGLHLQSLARRVRAGADGCHGNWPTSG